MLPTPATHRSRSDDPRQALRPGLVAAAFQASIPLAFFLLSRFPFAAAFWFKLPDYGFPVYPLYLFVDGGFNYIFSVLYVNATEPVSDGFIANFLPPLLLLGLVIIPLTGIGIIDYVVSRRTTQATGSLRVGLRVCLWGNLGYVAALLATALATTYLTLFQYNHFSPNDFSAVYFAVLAVFLLVQFSLAQGVSQIVGRWGGRHGLRARGDVPSATGDLAANDLASVRELATRGNLGAFVRVFTSLNTTTVIWRGIGLIVFFVALLFVQRGVFHVIGTEPFTLTVVGVVGSIAYLVSGARQRGQSLHVFQDGLVGLTREQRLIALRWDEMQPLSSRTPMRVTSRTGEQIVIYDTLAHADELKELIRQGIARAALAQR